MLSGHSHDWRKSFSVIEEGYIMNDYAFKSSSTHDTLLIVYATSKRTFWQLSFLSNMLTIIWE